MLELYDYACALCRLRLRWDQLIEAQAAHIKPRALLGVDDVRNAMALCRTHHWAFDEGLWTATDDLVVRVRVPPEGAAYDVRALEQWSGRTLRLPARSTARPHPLALAWHRDGPFGGERWGSGAV